MRMEGRLFWTLFIVGAFCTASTLAITPTKQRLNLFKSTEETTTTTEEPSEQETSFALLLLLALELFCFFTAYTLKQTHFKYLQEAGAYILFGAIVGGFVRFISSVQRVKDIVSFDAEVFFLVLLPPIIFESGYNMKRVSIF